MDTNSNNILSSNYCFLFEKCAREGGCQGAPGHGHSHLFETRGHLFLKRFSEGFFPRTWCQMEHKMASKIKENLKKNRLGTKPRKHVENLLKLIPLDLQETRFRMKWLSKITKTRGADKSKKKNKKHVSK